MLLSMLFLESNRNEILVKEVVEAKTLERARVVRTKGMIELLRQACHRELWGFVARASRGDWRAKRDLERFIMPVMGGSQGDVLQT